MRGLPGAGKSHFIQKNFSNAFVCSADEYFIGPDGNYFFVRENLGLAHQRCFNLFQVGLENSLPFVILDNTNTEIWEFEKYLAAAQDHDYQTFVLNFKIDFETALKRNKHKVQFLDLVKMVKKTEECPGEILLVND